jgi:hypothetical protein
MAKWLAHQEVFKYDSIPPISSELFSDLSKELIPHCYPRFPIALLDSIKFSATDFLKLIQPGNHLCLALPDP